MSRIISIGTAVPQYKSNQSDILEFMCKAYDNEIASRKLKILFHSSGIETRHSAVPDFGKSGTGKKFFADENQPNIEKRMFKYSETAVGIAVDAIKDSFKKINSSVESFGITHLITVTCTALYAPGIDIEIMEKLNLPHDTERNSVNFMGCNAAFPALKIADKITKAEKNAKVLVVCVELCTLHFQPKYDTDNLLSNTIFGDGAAAAIMVSDEQAEHLNLKGLSINRFYSALLKNGKNLMGWNVKPINFEMVLNAKVPAFIGDHIREFISTCEEKLNIKAESIGKWAVHPG
ncbi:MAG: type III polyketide synthase, partial [Prolixibacteraceae bacterium]